MDDLELEKSWQLFNSPHSAEWMSVSFQEVPLGEYVIYIKTRNHPESTSAITPRMESELQITEDLLPAFVLACEVMIKNMRSSPAPTTAYDAFPEIEVMRYGTDACFLIERYKRTFLIRYCANINDVKTLSRTQGLHVLDKEAHFPIKICIELNDSFKFMQLLGYARQTLHELKRKRYEGRNFSLFPEVGLRLDFETE